MTFAAVVDTKASVQDIRAGFGKRVVRVVNRPARYLPTPVWPIELRADCVAAFLDFRTTRELCRAIAKGYAPRPTAIRGKGRNSEAVWSRDAVAAFIAERHRLDRHRDADPTGEE